MLGSQAPRFRVVKIVVFAVSLPNQHLSRGGYLQKGDRREGRAHFGGSGDVLSKMVLSSGGDLCIPSSPEYMTKAIELGRMDPLEREGAAYLVPAIIVPKGQLKGHRRTPRPR